MAMFRILHIYSEILDLYGDYANVTAIKQAITTMGHECSISYCELWHDIDTTDFHLVYIGHGKAKNLAAVAEHFNKFKVHIAKQIEDGQVFFVTGNARLLFGRTFELYNGNTVEGIGLFDYHGRETGEVFVSDVLARPVFNRDITTYGFINRTAHIVGENPHPLFEVLSGKGDNEADGGFEGNLFNNYFGTWQMGPLLVRNPDMLREVLRRMMGSDYLPIKLPLEEEALKLTISEFKIN